MKESDEGSLKTEGEVQDKQTESLLNQVDALQQAKELAYAQARRKLKLHAHQMAREIESQTEQLLQELWDSHCQELDDLSELREEVQAGAREVLAMRLWAQRSVMRFVPLDQPVRLGSWQVCYLTEDYAQVHSVDTHCSQSVQDLRQMVLQRNQVRASPSFLSILEAGSSSEGSQEKLATKSSSIPDLTFLDRIRKPGKKICRSLSNIILRKRSGSLLAKLPSRQHSQSFTALSSTDDTDGDLKTGFPTDNGKILSERGSWLLKSHPQLTARWECVEGAKDVQLLPNGDLLCAAGNRVLSLKAGRGVDVFTTGGHPTCLSLTREHYVLVGDHSRVRAFTRGGMQSSIFGAGFFQEVISLAADQDDNLVLLDRDRVCIYNPMTGNTVNVSCEGQPQGVAVGGASQVYITNLTNGICCYNKDHGCLESIVASSESCLHSPRGICTQDDVLYVADWEGNRVAAFRTDGQFLKHVLTAEHGIMQPIRVTTTAQRLAVLQDNGTVSVFDLTNSYRSNDY